jgi:hypothetical protein
MTARPIDLLEPPAGPSSFRVRVELLESEPPIWRALEVPSDIRLDALHDVLQAAMGWVDSHLHHFSPTRDMRDPAFRSIVTPYDVAEGEVGTLESELRLDTLIGPARTDLHYLYDFGDGWEHVVRWEATSSRPEGSRRVRCTEAHRACPPEDCGGIGAYESMLALSRDVGNTEYAEAAEHLYYFGLRPGFVDAAETRTIAAALDRLEAVDAGLVVLGTARSPSPLAELAAVVEATRPAQQRLLAGYVGVAHLDAELDLESVEAGRATRAFRTLLDYIGDDGVTLTAAGYLPAKSVSFLMGELDPEGSWPGTSMRESDTRPLLFFREAVVRLKLARRFKGKLVLTRAGSAIRSDPIALWQHIVSRLPQGRDEAERECSLLLLLLVAAGTDDEAVGRDLDLLTAVTGWRFEGAGRYGNAAALHLVQPTREVVEWLATGALIRRPSALAFPAARRAARAALAAR